MGSPRENWAEFLIFPVGAASTQGQERKYASGTSCFALHPADRYTFLGISEAESGGKPPTLGMCWKAMLLAFDKAELMGRAERLRHWGRRGCATAAALWSLRHQVCARVLAGLGEMAEVSVSQDPPFKLMADLLNVSLGGISKNLCRLIKIDMGIENIHLCVVSVLLLHKMLNYFNCVIWENSKSHSAHTTETWEVFASLYRMTAATRVM